jgi:hypothetical protein
MVVMTVKIVPSFKNPTTRLKFSMGPAYSLRLPHEWDAWKKGLRKQRKGQHLHYEKGARYSLEFSWLKLASICPTLKHSNFEKKILICYEKPNQRRAGKLVSSLHELYLDARGRCVHTGGIRTAVGVPVLPTPPSQVEPQYQDVAHMQRGSSRQQKKTAACVF